MLHNAQRFALALLQLLFRAAFCLGQLDVVALAQPPDGLQISKMLVLLQEGDGVAGLAATEALEDAQLRAHIEGGRLLVVEWAQAQVTRPFALERHEFTHHVLDAGGILYLLYGFRGDHPWRIAKVPRRRAGGVTE